MRMRVVYRGGGGVHSGTAGNQRRDDGGATALRRYVQRRDALGVDDVGLRPGLK